MLKRTVAVLAVIGALCAAPAYSQNGGAGGLGELLTGSATPLSYKLKDLNTEWRRVVIRQVGDPPKKDDSFEQLMRLGMLSGSDGDGDAAGAMAAMSLFGGMMGGGDKGGSGSDPVYYTKGQTVTLGSETFLVAYRHEKPEVNILQLSLDAANTNKEPDFKKLATEARLGEESDLRLALINVENIVSLSGIRAFDLKTEIADAAKSFSLLEMIGNEMGKANAATTGGGAPEGSANDLNEAASDVRLALALDPQFNAPGNKVTVLVRRGVIVLDGSVTSDTLQTRAANVARRIVTEYSLPSTTFVNQIKVVR